MDGFKHPHSTKDATVKPYKTKLTKAHVVTMVDVDFHTDMNYWLLHAPTDVVIYTTLPERAGGTVGNSTTYFEDGYYHEVVAGGAHYKHKLWDYKERPNGANVVVKGFTCETFFCFPIPWTIKYRWKSFRMERRSVTTSKAVILLECMESHTWLSALIARFNYRHEKHGPLQRLDPTVGNFTSFEVYPSQPLNKKHRDQDGNHVASAKKVPEVLLRPYRTIAYKGDRSSSEIALTALHNLQSKYRMTPKSFHVATVTQHVPKGTDPATVALIYEYVTTTTKLDQPEARIFTHHYTEGSGVKDVQRAGHGQYDPDTTKRKLHDYTTPLLGPVDDATKCINNTIQTINERVKKHQHKTVLALRKKDKLAINEYIKRLVPCAVAQTLDPVSNDEVRKRQSAPQQRKILDAYFDGDVDADTPNKATMFTKAGDPGIIGRAIFIPKTDTKVRASKLLYSVSDHIKRQDKLHGLDSPFSFYAFNKTPLQVANLVTRTAMCADQGLTSSDLSKQDAHDNNVINYFFGKFLKRLFKVEHHGEIDLILRNSVFNRCFTNDAQKFNTMMMLMSGLPQTSLRNTLSMSLIGFCCYIDLGYGYDDAFSLIQRCVFGGDDSLLIDVPTAKVEATAKRFGEVVKATFTPKHSLLPVEFFSRIYSPQIWNGTNHSVVVWRRAALKAHTTTRKGVDSVYRGYKITWQLRKFLEKCASWNLSAPTTPFFGPVSRRALLAAKQLGLLAQTTEIDEDGLVEVMARSNQGAILVIGKGPGIDLREQSWLGRDSNAERSVQFPAPPEGSEWVRTHIDTTVSIDHEALEHWFEAADAIPDNWSKLQFLLKFPQLCDYQPHPDLDSKYVVDGEWQGHADDAKVELQLTTDMSKNDLQDQEDAYHAAPPHEREEEKDEDKNLPGDTSTCACHPEQEKEQTTFAKLHVPAKSKVTDSRRKFVVAPSGSGKSTFAQSRSWILDLDTIFAWPDANLGHWWHSDTIRKRTDDHNLKLLQTWLSGPADGMVGLYADDFDQRQKPDAYVVIPEDQHLANIKKRWETNKTQPGMLDWPQIQKRRNTMKADKAVPVYTSFNSLNKLNGGWLTWTKLNADPKSQKRVMFKRTAKTKQKDTARSRRAAKRATTNVANAVSAAKTPVSQTSATTNRPPLPTVLPPPVPKRPRTPPSLPLELVQAQTLEDAAEFERIAKQYKVWYDNYGEEDERKRLLAEKEGRKWCPLEQAQLKADSDAAAEQAARRQKTPASNAATPSPRDVSTSSNAEQWYSTVHNETDTTNKLSTPPKAKLGSKGGPTKGRNKPARAKANRRGRGRSKPGRGGRGSRGRPHSKEGGR